MRLTAGYPTPQPDVNGLLTKSRDGPDRWWDERRARLRPILLPLAFQAAAGSDY